MIKQKLHSFSKVTRLAAVAMTFAVLVGQASVQAADAPADAKPEDKGWETSASAGVTVSQGNSKGYQANLGLNSVRKWSKDEVLLGVNAGYGESTAVKRADNAPDVTTKSDDYMKGFSQWNHLITERFYGGLRLDAIHDDIADVNYRFTLSPLVGYYFIKDATTYLAAEVGPSLVYEQVGGEEKTYAGLRLAERFEHKFQSGARVWQTAEIIPQVDDVENFIVNFEIGAEAPITKKMGIRLVLQDTYDNQPAEVRGAANALPPGTQHYYKLKNDMKIIGSLTYKF